MSLAVIILVPILAGFGFLYWASQCDEHPILKLVFQLLWIPLVYMSLNFAVIDVGLVYDSNPELVERLSNIVYYLGWIFFGIGVYYSFVIFKGAYDVVLQKRMDKNEEKYD